MTKKSKGTHAKMKPNPGKTPEGVKHLQNEVMLNKVALAIGVEMLAQLHPNNSDLGAAVRKALNEGLNVAEVQQQLIEKNNAENPQSNAENPQN